MKRADITRQLAEFVVKANYEDLTLEAVETAKRVILDILGIGVGGFIASREEVAPVIKVTEELGGAEECTVLVSGKKTSWFNAILINGTFMHSLDYDDTRKGLFVHTSAVVVPAVLALGEKLGFSGREAILATVLGHEVIARIADSVMPSHYHYWHAMGTNGTFGGAVVAGKLLGLNADEMERALGIAADQASGLVSSVEGNLTKSLHGGLTSAKGVLSAMLVRHGATGPRGILENPRGYCSAYSKEPAIDKIVFGLGQTFDIMNNCPKFYPSILCSHCAIQATLKLVKENNLRAEDVLKIEEKIYNVPVPPAAFESRRSKTTLEARLNHPYCIAVTILDGELGMRQFERERLEDERIWDLVKKTTVQVDPKMDELYHTDQTDMRPVSVTITIRDGRVLTALERYPKGYPKNPMSAPEMERKFETLCSYAFDNERIEELKRAIHHLESSKDISKLMTLLVRG